MRKPLVVELLIILGPILVLWLFAFALRAQSPWPAMLNILLGSFMIYNEKATERESQSVLDRTKSEMLGEKPSLGHKVAAYWLILTSSSGYKHAAWSKVTSFIGVFVGTIQLLTYW